MTLNNLSLRLYYRDDLGWVLSVPRLLTEDQLGRICSWALPRAISRLRSMPTGDKKQAFKQAVNMLFYHQITQRLIENDGILVPFSATDRETNRKVFYG